MDRKRCANDTLRSRVRKHRVISRFKENSIQNHSDSKDGGKVHKFLLYLLQNIIFRNKLLFISVESVEHNVKEQNIEVDNLDHLLTFEAANILHSTHKNHSFNTFKHVIHNNCINK